MILFCVSIYMIIMVFISLSAGAWGGDMDLSINAAIMWPILFIFLLLQIFAIVFFELGRSLFDRY